MKLNAIVLGGSGSVGAALLRELFNDDAFATVISVSRRSVATDRKLVEVLVAEMNPASLYAATLQAAKDFQGELEGFSVLGVGAGTAKLTLEQHRAVDIDLNEAFAKALRDSGKVKHFAFMSAVGADPNAKGEGSGAAGTSRYNKVKGQSEVAVRASGPPIVSIFRPSMIIGSQHTPWILEKGLPLLSFITPANFRSIRVDQIARAMVASAKHHPASSGIYHYPEMLAMGGK